MPTGSRSSDDGLLPEPSQDEVTTVGPTRALDDALGFEALDPPDEPGPAKDGEAWTAGPFEPDTAPVRIGVPRQVLTKPRPPSSVNARPSGLNRVDRGGRTTGEGLVRPVAPRSGLIAAPRVEGASAPRPLIRPSPRANDSGPLPGQAPAPRSLDRAIMHARRSSHIGSEAPDAPLARAREEATREPTQPTYRPDLTETDPPLGADDAAIPGDASRAAPSYEDTIRGMTLKQLGEHASLRPQLAAGIEPGPVVASRVDAGAMNAVNPAGAGAPTSTEVPSAHVDRSPSAPRSVLQARATTAPYDINFEVAAPARSAVAAPPSFDEHAIVEPPRLGRRDDPREREIRARPEDAATATETTLRPSVTSILPKISPITLVLLFQAIALPTAAGPPWELLARPAEVTLQALAAFVLVGVVHLLPCRERTRGVFGLVFGVMLLPFAFVAWRAAIASGTFDAQPALVALMAGPLPTPALPALLALVLVPAGLFARGHRSPRSDAWVLTGAGLSAAVVAFAWMPLAGLFASVGDAPFLGDRVAAWATLPLFAALAFAVAALVWPPLSRRATGFGFIVWGTALVPLIVLALFAAKSDQWLQVLEPVKLVSFLGAITLYTAAALATTVNPRMRDL